MADPAAMVQKRPVKESAMRPPASGVRLERPWKLVSVLEASTSGRRSCCVRYVIRLALKPAVAKRSQISFAAGRGRRIGYHHNPQRETLTGNSDRTATLPRKTDPSAVTART